MCMRSKQDSTPLHQCVPSPSLQIQHHHSPPPTQGCSKHHQSKYYRKMYFQLQLNQCPHREDKSSMEPNQIQRPNHSNKEEMMSH